MEKVSAICRNGILEIRLAKRPLDRVQKISIQGS
jgi:HSP20 family molecular chaperone IbpA